MKRKDIFFVGAFMVSFMLCAVVMTGDYFYQYLERGYRWHREEQTEPWHAEKDEEEPFGNTEEIKERPWTEKDKTEEKDTRPEESLGTLASEEKEQERTPDQSEVTEEEITDSRTLVETLFIGDSRTVGLMEYGGIENADFFADSGMSVFSLQMKEIAVGDVGKVSLEELLAEKRYGKIYIMLGINELGYRFDAIQNKYQECLALIQNSQSEAVIYLCANMHVTKKQSEKDDIYNNENVNKVNAMIANLAESMELQYLDVNELFDDETGNLSDTYSSDSFHVLGKYYTDWAAWIKEKEV